VSRRRGRPSNRELPADLHARVLALIRERYADFGPTLACEKLYECHGIRLAKETVNELGVVINRRNLPIKQCVEFLLVHFIFRAGYRPTFGALSRLLVFLSISSGSGTKRY
jgi:hypothetical protein